MWIFYCWYCVCYCLQDTEFHKKKLSGWLSSDRYLELADRYLGCCTPCFPWASSEVWTPVIHPPSPWLHSPGRGKLQPPMLRGVCVPACASEKGPPGRSQGACSVPCCDKGSFHPVFQHGTNGSQSKSHFGVNMISTVTSNTELKDNQGRHGRKAREQ